MSSPFVAQVSMFGFNFAPKGWAICNGQLLPISQNTALFSLLGTNYGGDGKSTFGLPNFQGMASVGQGQGAGLSSYSIGESTGAENVTLLQTEMPSHNHSLVGTSTSGTTLTAMNNQLAKAFSGGKQASYTGNYLSTNAPQTPMSGQALTTAGNSFPHNNMQPYLTLNFCIAMQGVFPARP
ncbi:MAG TPA: tail fiber protein [Rhizomicrobium sp.]|jgi:microcystin-dependent protein|nr:tail fiber protein [Rhizomicrobium sp.]